MWEAMDCRDHALVRLTQQELWREAAMRRLAHQAGGSRRSRLGRLAARFSAARRAPEPATA